MFYLHKPISFKNPGASRLWLRLPEKPDLPALLFFHEIGN